MPLWTVHPEVHAAHNVGAGHAPRPHDLGGVVVVYPLQAEPLVLNWKSELSTVMGGCLLQFKAHTGMVIKIE